MRVSLVPNPVIRHALAGRVRHPDIALGNGDITGVMADQTDGDVRSDYEATSGLSINIFAGFIFRSCTLNQPNGGRAEFVEMARICSRNLRS